MLNFYLQIIYIIILVLSIIFFFKKNIIKIMFISILINIFLFSAIILCLQENYNLYFVIILLLLFISFDLVIFYIYIIQKYNFKKLI